MSPLPSQVWLFVYDKQTLNT